METVSNRELLVGDDGVVSTSKDGVAKGDRTPLVLVTGLDSTAVARVGEALVGIDGSTGTVVVHHDLGRVADGRVVRRTAWVDAGGRRHDRETEVELAHGCVSCTLREDLLPLLRRLHQRSSVRRIVVVLDPIMEPERICWAVEHVVIAQMPGFVDGPAGRDVRVEATIALCRRGHLARGGDR
ncbi:hypothetical protein GCM10022238_44340 [Gordonia hankookensis]